MILTNKKTLFFSFIGLIVLLTLYTMTLYGFFGPHPIGTTDTSTRPLIVPQGFAFSIWGLIYTGLIAFPIYQLIKRKETYQWYSLRIWYSLNVILNGLWLVFASYDWLWMTVIIILMMLTSLVKIDHQIREMKKEKIEINYWMESFVFSVYFGWVTVATILNVAAALKFYQWNGWGIPELYWSLIILSVAAVIFVKLFRWYRDQAFISVGAWAFWALTLRHWGGLPILAYFSLAIMILFILLIINQVAQPNKNAS
jgi:benzodiazapine receptor|tara:strand:- start:593 stop:1357 length:765 start_codon:yes stop_codon:yes gene_type:complete